MAVFQCSETVPDAIGANLAPWAHALRCSNAGGAPAGLPRSIARIDDESVNHLPLRNRFIAPARTIATNP